MEQWDLWLGEERVGKVSCRENEWGYTLWAACPAEEGYIYRVALDQENEDVLVAGVMLPQGREFRLEKKMDGYFAPEKVRGAFILRSRPGEYTGFSPLPFPLEKFRPFDLSRVPWNQSLLGKLLADEKARVCRYQDQWYAAAPLEREQPFVLAPFFQKVTPLEMGGKRYGLVVCDEEGRVSLAHNVKEAREYWKGNQ